MTDSERNPCSQDAQLSGVEEEVDDEETAESENGDEPENKVNTVNLGAVGRLVTLQNLLGAGILQPGPGAMTIDYLGQKFTGDLLANGKIRSHETDRIFASPSAWAVSCKKIVNPDKRSGCGWSSIRYRGKKLDSFKSIWLMKKSESLKDNENMEDHEMDGKPNEHAQDASENDQKQGLNDKENQENINDNASVNQEQQEQGNDKQNEESQEQETQSFKLEHKPRIVVKHNILGNRVPNHDPNVLVESNTFTSLGKIQPFLITISTNAALVMDFHCHLTSSEVVGYLAGNWDVNSHNLNITHAFPCKCRLGDYESAPLVENEIRKTIKSNHLTVVGWYHSHPTAPATPSIRDIDTQLDYELKMKGSNDSTYLPCVGIICSPYNADNPTFESNIVSYWVVPPPENRIYEYGKPMMMSYSVLQDQSISHDVLLEMKKCADFYKPEKDYIQFSEIIKEETTYLEKMKQSLTSKFPLNQQKTDALWNYLEDIVSTSTEKSETEILKQIIDISSTPSVTPPVTEKPKFNIPNIPSPLSFKTNNTTNSKESHTSSNSPNNNNNNNAQYPKSHSRSKSSNKRSTSRENKNLASLNNYFVGSDLASALFGTSKFPMGLDPTTKSLLNLSSLSLGNMFMPPMGSYKPDPNVGLMKPPPPPSSYYSYASSRSSNSRSSSSPSSSSGSSRSSSKNLPSTSRDMPPPNKVPKLDVHQMANFFMPPNLNKMCTITSRPSTSTSSK